MHPAYSVIVFTCASGAGYGLLFWLGLSAATSAGAARPAPIGWLGFGVAFALITIGLLSSTAHLGRPERAWRALSQWRTSWLSREGVMAIVTYAVGGLFALAWLFGGPSGGLLVCLLGMLTLVSAAVTIWCTGMIYASLPTIRAWNHRLVAPIYVLLGLLTGRLLQNAVLTVLGGTLSTRAVWLTLVLLLAGWLAKTFYWHEIDEARRSHTIGEATGLGRFGPVRTLDPPHTQANFVMREMGYAVARRQAGRLRQIVVALLFIVPAAATLGTVLGGVLVGALLAVLAVLAAAVGVGIERWLFFAEAEHVSMLYYGRETA